MNSVEAEQAGLVEHGFLLQHDINSPAQLVRQYGQDPGLDVLFNNCDTKRTEVSEEDHKSSSNVTDGACASKKSIQFCSHQKKNFLNL